MKKLLYLFFIFLSLSTFVDSRPKERKSNVVSVDGEKNMSEVLSQLKRRYPRKYNFDKSQGDDFGFAPCYSKKSWKV
ncbi:MAG: hypothetical protein JO129_04445 [Candidatus Dependentiae bacterium]|nr:hypothetical protein [Candidatus Dependentiae bacterium]